MTSSKPKASLFSSVLINDYKEIIPYPPEQTDVFTSNSSVYVSAYSASKQRKISIIITGITILLLMCFMLLIAKL